MQLVIRGEILVYRIVPIMDNCVVIQIINSSYVGFEYDNGVNICITSETTNVDCTRGNILSLVNSLKISLKYRGSIHSEMFLLIYFSRVQLQTLANRILDASIVLLNYQRYA